MNGLILETSTEKGAIVLAYKDTPLDTISLLGGPHLSKNLALEVKLLLKKHSLKPDYIATGIGPGSFTGIRVGAALAKALSFGWDIPLFGFCSLSAFSPLDAPSHAVVVDARMGGIYVLTGKTARLVPICEAEETLKNETLLFSPHPEIIKKRISSQGKWLECVPNPITLATLGFNLFVEGKKDSLSLVYQ